MAFHRDSGAHRRHRGPGQPEKAEPGGNRHSLVPGATQSAGLGLEAGSDAKPLHAGFAARNAVYAWELFRYTRVTASQRPFNNDNGCSRCSGT